MGWRGSSIRVQGGSPTFPEGAETIPGPLAPHLTDERLKRGWDPALAHPTSWELRVELGSAVSVKSLGLLSYTGRQMPVALPSITYSSLSSRGCGGAASPGATQVGLHRPTSEMNKRATGSGFTSLLGGSGLASSWASQIGKQGRGASSLKSPNILTRGFWCWLGNECTNLSSTIR